MDWKERLAKSAQMYQEARALLAKADRSAEDEQKAQKLIEDARTIKAQAAELKELDAEAEGILEGVEAEQAEIAPDDRSKFAAWGDFLKAAYRVGKSQVYDQRLKYFDDDQGRARQAKDLAEAVGSTGGFLVPTEFQTQLMSFAASESVVRPRATVIRMRRRAIQIPVLDQTGSTAGKPNWFGGMQAYWAEEAAEKSQTDPAFRQIELVAHKLIMYTRSSDELLDDSALSLQDFLSGPMGFAGAIAWYEDYAFIHGSGAGQPLGVVNAPATITVNRQTQNGITYTDLTTMLENFLPSGQGVWLMTQSALSDMLQLNGPTGNPSFIWGSAVNGAPNTLLGLPVIFTEKASRIGTAGDVILADWRYYLIGDRQATTVESTQFDRWRYDQTSWRGVHRVDGQPWMSAPLTYQDGTTQVSPFVILGDKVT